MVVVACCWLCVVCCLLLLVVCYVVWRVVVVVAVVLFMSFSLFVVCGLVLLPVTVPVGRGKVTNKARAMFIAC